MKPIPNISFTKPSRFMNSDMPMLEIPTLPTLWGFGDGYITPQAVGSHLTELSQGPKRAEPSSAGTSVAGRVEPLQRPEVLTCFAPYEKISWNFKRIPSGKLT